MSALIKAIFYLLFALSYIQIIIWLTQSTIEVASISAVNTCSFSSEIYTP